MLEDKATTLEVPETCLHPDFWLAGPSTDTEPPLSSVGSLWGCHLHAHLPSLLFLPFCVSRCQLLRFPQHPENQ